MGTTVPVLLSELNRHLGGVVLLHEVAEALKVSGVDNPNELGVRSCCPKNIITCARIWSGWTSGTMGLPRILKMAAPPRVICWWAQTAAIWWFVVWCFRESIRLTRATLFGWAWYLQAAPGAELDAVLTDNKGRRRVSAIPPGAMSEAQNAAFRKVAEKRINPAFLELIHLTQDVFVQAIRDLKVRQMVFKRVMLMGDAAFIPRSHTAGVTAKAVENAMTLARMLAQYPDMDEGLRRWEQIQLKEGTTMSAWGIDMGNRIMGIGEYAGLRK